MPSAPPTRRRWLQFGLGPMLMFFTALTACAAWLGLEVQFVRERRAEVRVITESCNFVWSSAYLRSRSNLGPAPPELPIWRRWLGDEAIAFISYDDATAEQEARWQRLFP